jgi:hypothetical protein
VYHNNPRRRLP